MVILTLQILSSLLNIVFWLAYSIELNIQALDMVIYYVK